MSAALVVVVVLFGVLAVLIDRVSLLVSPVLFVSFVGVVGILGAVIYRYCGARERKSAQWMGLWQHMYATGPRRRYFTRSFRNTGQSSRPSWPAVVNTCQHTSAKNLTSS